MPPGRAGSHGSSDVLRGRPFSFDEATAEGLRPAPRGRVGAARLLARDRWNTSEIKIQELLTAMDRDGMGNVGHQEFHELLHSDFVQSLNGGRALDDQEILFVIRVARLEESGARVSFAVAHDALRAWHALKCLDDASMLLFAEFDLDPKRIVDQDALRGLMTALNGGLSVPVSEVRWVAEQAVASAAPSGGRPQRRDVFRAICAWHAQVDRAVTALPTVWREAATRTAKDLDQVRSLRTGVRALDQTVSLLAGGQGIHGTGYLHVDGQAAEHDSVSPQAAAMLSGGHGSGALDSQEAATFLTPHDAPGGRPQSSRQDASAPTLGPTAVKAVGKLCLVGFPFLLGLFLFVLGLRHQENSCPRNLDGLLVWFGLLLVAFSVLQYARPEHWVVHLRIALSVMLTLLCFVGVAWSFDIDVDSEMQACGSDLVFWSRATWLIVPTGLASGFLWVCSGHVKRLRDFDRRLQRDVLV